MRAPARSRLGDGCSVADDIFLRSVSPPTPQNNISRCAQVGNLTTFDWSIDHKADPVADDKNKEAFSAMCDALPASEARFVIFDFADMRPDGRQIKKLVLIKWCPDAVTFRVKPVVGASYQTLKEKCVWAAPRVPRRRAQPAASATPLPPPAAPIAPFAG